MTPPLLAAVGVAAGYRGRPVLHDASLAVGAGELVGLVGPNGAGKTTLLRVLTGLLRPMAGEVRLDGRSLAAWPRAAIARRVAVVPQEDDEPLPYRVGEIVLMGRAPHRSWLGLPTAPDVAAATAAMATADVGGLADRYPDECSGGERQRVRLARALAQEPAVLLLDEPTAHLDPHHRWRLYEVLDRLRAERGCAVCVVTHDLHPLLARADRVVLLAGGRVVADGPPRAVAGREALAAVFAVPPAAVPATFDVAS
jgi:iron complex transport system ATP-binding protein